MTRLTPVDDPSQRDLFREARRRDERRRERERRDSAARAKAADAKVDPVAAAMSGQPAPPSLRERLGDAATQAAGVVAATAARGAELAGEGAAAAKAAIDRGVAEATATPERRGTAAQGVLLAALAALGIGAWRADRKRPAPPPVVYPPRPLPPEPVDRPRPGAGAPIRATEHSPSSSSSSSSSSLSMPSKAPEPLASAAATGSSAPSPTPEAKAPPDTSKQALAQRFGSSGDHGTAASPGASRGDADAAHTVAPPKVSPASVWAMVKQSATAWIDDRAPTMGAALSYYTTFSMAPLLLIVVSVAGLIFGAEAARGEIFGQIRGLVGDGGAKAIEGLLESANKPSGGVFATILGIVLMLVGATTVFAELQDTLDAIWRAPKRESSGLWGLLRARVLSFGLILGIGFLLVVSLMFSAAISAMQKMLSPSLAGWETVVEVVNYLIGFGLITVMFAVIYKLMPRVKIAWSDVWVGALVTAGLFTIGRWLIGLYISKAAVDSGFGAAGSLVIVLVWMYYSAQIFLLGAEFTWVYAHTFGSRRNEPIPPKTDGLSAAPSAATVAATKARAAA